MGALEEIPGSCCKREGGGYNTLKNFGYGLQ